MRRLSDHFKLIEMNMLRLAATIVCGGALAASTSDRDWRAAACLTPVMDEGARDRHLPLGAAALDSILCQTNSTAQYSVEQIVDCAADLQGTRSALDYVLTQGLELEADYPAGASPGPCRYSSAKVALRISSVLNGSSDAAMASVVASTSPVTASMAVGEAYMAYTGGVITDCGGNSTNHIVSVVGVTDEHWTVKESWGSDWGSGGFAFVARGSCHLGEDFAYAKP